MRTQIGQYRIEAILGRGGMGVVYRGAHAHLGRPVAVKALAPELTRQPEFKERFFTEAKTQARLQHPNIVGVYDLIEDAGEYFIVMELVEGEGLDDRLQGAAGRGMGLSEAAGVFAQVLAALDYAHSEGVIHRDIKPSNVMITAGGQAKLTDFGIALLVGDKRLTASQSSIGTPTYMSPEQILRPRSLDHRTDLYSAAVVFYEMLAGRPPFDGETEYGIKKLHVEAPPPDISLLRPGLPENLLAALSTALAKDPEDRYASAGMFLRALSDVVPQGAVRTVLSTPSPPSHRPTLTDTDRRGAMPWRGRYRRAVLAAALLVPAIGVGTATLLFRPGGGEEVKTVAATTVEPPGALPPPAAPLPEPAPAPVLPETPDARQPSQPKPERPAAPSGEPPPTRVKKAPKVTAAPAAAVSPPIVRKPKEALAASGPAVEPEPARSAAEGPDLAMMEGLVLSLERSSQQVLRSYRREGGQDGLLSRLEAFHRDAEEVRKEFRRVTGTGKLSRLLGRQGHGDVTELEARVRSLARRFDEIEGAIGSSSPGTRDAWQEVRGHVKRLEGCF